MIAIVDYGMGNLGSIHNMLQRLGVPAVIAKDQRTLVNASKLILPGVGAFDKAMENLKSLGIIPLLNELVLNNKMPVLGICLGMQLLSLKSEEGVLGGLGWIDAETRRFRFEDTSHVLRIPHMGWNHVVPRMNDVLFKDMYDNPRFYFVHSYHVSCKDERDVLATTTYGITFHSAVMRGNIMGTQFHPEKSHKFGMKVLKNFAEI